jgi:serralysin
MAQVHSTTGTMSLSSPSAPTAGQPQAAPVHATGAGEQSPADALADGGDSVTWWLQGDPFPGTVFSEALLGGLGCDLLSGAVGDQVIDGGPDVDTVVYTGVLADYDIVRVAQGIGVWGAEGRDLLVAVERLQFADTNVAMDGDGAAGQAWRLYRAAFDRAPDAAGLGFWLQGLDAGLHLAAMAQHLMDSPEFSQRYGAPDSSQFVAQLYANVLHRAPDDAGRAYWQQQLDEGRLGRADALVHFSESAENQAALAGVIDNGMLYTL